LSKNLLKDRGLLTLWLLATWQTDNGTLIFNYMMKNKKKLEAFAVFRQSYEGASGGVFCRYRINMKIFFLF
jgi:hypothetical protein